MGKLKGFTTAGLFAAFAASALPGTAGDFDGDGISDIVWRHGSTGRNQLWLSARSGMRGPIPTVRDPSWSIVAIGDFAGDGRADLVWRNLLYGANALWPDGRPARAFIPDVRERSFVDAVGDFDGDGKDDLFWRNLWTGGNAMWPSAQPGGIQVRSVNNLQWQVHGAGDFDGDGLDDVLWRNPYTGANTIWLSAIQETTQEVASLHGDSWLVAGIGDFDGDGMSDVAWHNWKTGENMIWPDADAARMQPLAWIDTQRGDWRALVGDYDGDGRDDLLWRHAIESHAVIWHGGDAADTRQVARVDDPTWQLEPGRPWGCDEDRARWGISLTATPELLETLMHASRAHSYAVNPVGVGVRNRLAIHVDSFGRVEDAYCN